MKNTRVWKWVYNQNRGRVVTCNVYTKEGHAKSNFQLSSYMIHFVCTLYKGKCYLDEYLAAGDEAGSWVLSQMQPGYGFA